MIDSDNDANVTLLPIADSLIATTSFTVRLVAAFSLNDKVSVTETGWKALVVTDADSLIATTSFTVRLVAAFSLNDQVSITESRLKSMVLLYATSLIATISFK